MSRTSPVDAVFAAPSSAGWDDHLEMFTLRPALEDDLFAVAASGQ
jgi:hypothetical protein